MWITRCCYLLLLPLLRLGERRSYLLSSIVGVKVKDLTIYWITCASFFFSLFAKVKLSPGFETKHISCCCLLGSLSFATALWLGRAQCGWGRWDVRVPLALCRAPRHCPRVWASSAHCPHRGTLRSLLAAQLLPAEHFSGLAFNSFFPCECKHVNKRITAFKNTIYPIKAFQHVNYGALNSRQLCCHNPVLLLA